MRKVKRFLLPILFVFTFVAFSFSFNSYTKENVVSQIETTITAGQWYYKMVAHKADGTATFSATSLAQTCEADAWTYGAIYTTPCGYVASCCAVTGDLTVAYWTWKVWQEGFNPVASGVWHCGDDPVSEPQAEPDSMPIPQKPMTPQFPK